MANKKKKNQAQQASQQRAKQQQYEAATKNLFIFPSIAIGTMVLVLLLFFATFADVYNAAVKSLEFSVSGWSFVASGFTNLFTGEYLGANASLYGALVEPFYDYATEWCETVATVSVFTVVLVVINLALQIVALIKRNHSLNLVGAVLNLIVFILLIVCYAECLDMNNATIITDYCGNPDCVIRSTAVMPAIVALGGCVANSYASVRYLKAKNLLK